MYDCEEMYCIVKGKGYLKGESTLKNYIISEESFHLRIENNENKIF